MIQRTSERVSTLMVAQRMHYTARRFLTGTRFHRAPVALLVEPDLHSHTTEPLVNAIRGNQIVRLPWSQLTLEEQRQTHINLLPSDL